MRSVRPLALLGAVLLMIAAGASGRAIAQTLCSAPVTPLCVGVDSTYQDSGATARCRDDLKRYSDDVDSYLACLKKKTKELIDQRKTLEDAFTCRKNGGTNCPNVSTLPGG